MRYTRHQKAAFLIAADACRDLQKKFTSNAERVIGRPRIKASWFDNATGAGSCALELECMAGLSFDQIAKRNKDRK